MSTEVHERIMAIADERGWNVNAVLANLTDDMTVHIPMMPGQHERWKQAADLKGMPLPVWVVGHVESALHYGADRGTVERIHANLTAIAQHFGIHTQ